MLQPHGPWFMSFSQVHLIFDENLWVVQRKYSIFQRSHDSSDVKIQRSRVDYGFKFPTLKGGKYVLNSWVGLKKSETKSFMIIVINSE